MLSNGQFETLSQLGIVSISLTLDSQPHADNGNIVYGTISYETANGQTGIGAEVGFGISSNDANLNSHDILSQKIDFSKLPESHSVSYNVSHENSSYASSSAPTSMAPENTNHYTHVANFSHEIQHLDDELYHHHLHGHHG
jgi:hypothetical protein